MVSYQLFIFKKQDPNSFPSSPEYDGLHVSNLNKTSFSLALLVVNDKEVFSSSSNPIKGELMNSLREI